MGGSVPGVGHKAMKKAYQVLNLMEFKYISFTLEIIKYLL
jgi:hypothetical protein